MLVWLHGGGFSTGSANESQYDGEALAKKGDVVVVTVNHRLNVFGYLDLSAYGEKYRYSANVGMLDIVAALEWIQQNIAVFGGDPDNVTVFGQSGGGAKVLGLMTTPYADGLFDKGIVESGVTETVGVVFNSQEASTGLTENLLAFWRLPLKISRTSRSFPWTNCSRRPPRLWSRRRRNCSSPQLAGGY